MSKLDSGGNASATWKIHNGRKYVVVRDDDDSNSIQAVYRVVGNSALRQVKEARRWPPGLDTK